MTYKDGKISGINIAYIGGGSREWAWKLITDLALESSLSGTVKLYDIDYKFAAENMAVGNSVNKRKEAKSKWKYQAVKTLKEALTGADFAVLSILPGTFEEMMSDVHWPEKYGIYQTVGDTTGPGGLIRAMRTMPAYIEFAQAIKKYCPKAWVINYTNPMTICVRTLYEVFPEIKAFGCCHEVFHLQDLFMELVKDFKLAKTVEREEIVINVLGINHFTWINKVSYKGYDLLKFFPEFIKIHQKEGFDRYRSQKWPEHPQGYKSLIVFDLFKKFGIIGAAGDRHLVEFIPDMYLKDLNHSKKFKFNLTPVKYRIKQREELNAYRQLIVEGKEQLKLVPSGEEGVRQIKALLGLGCFVTNVNMPNRGQMDNVSSGAVVETNAYFTRDAIYPVVSGALPDNINKLVSVHITNQEKIVKAGINKDKKMAFEAFRNDPAVKRLDDKNALKLFNEMTDNTKKYLSHWGIE